MGAASDDEKGRVVVVSKVGLEWLVKIWGGWKKGGGDKLLGFSVLMWMRGLGGSHGEDEREFEDGEGKGKREELGFWWVV